MRIDENIFFREATLRICGDLEIDKALRNCLLYLRDYIPSDFMGFVIYIPGEECFETIARARPSESDTLPLRVPVPSPDQARLKIGFTEPRITIIDSIGRNPGAGRMIRELGWPDGSCLMMEMVLAGKRMGALVIISEVGTAYTDEHAALIRLLNEPMGVALTNCLRYRKVRELKNRLADDKQYLQDELRRMTPRNIIGADYGLKGVMEAVNQVGPLNSPVLLTGETGVGKEVIAMAVHNASPRRKGPFVKVNCGAITEGLIDSELFGHEKGAFTGAIARKRGRFERADGGTIFLDEIGELPPDAQVRLLRVLQDREFERVGGETTLAVDCRIVAATHRDIGSMIRRGRFREDLYFRLNVFPVAIPPLRFRARDIPALVHHFIQIKSREMALPETVGLAPGTLERLMNHDWPGNVRELENAVERELIIARGGVLRFDSFRTVSALSNRPGDGPDATAFPELDRVMADHIQQALDIADGKVEGINGAAGLLGINPGTLRQRMRKLGIPFGRKARAATAAAEGGGLP